MTGDALRLEPLAAEHLTVVGEVISDESVVRFTGFPWPPEPGFERTWFARYEAGRLEGTREAFAVLDAGGTMTGLALAVHIDRVAAEIELGYLVDPRQQGRGVGTALLTALTDWAFDDAAAARVTLVIATDNAASLRIAAKAGYRREGVMRSRYFKQGRRLDSELWAMITADRG
jgi:RimJ/RimL family protein N-acetyltransferase